VVVGHVGDRKFVLAMERSAAFALTPCPSPCAQGEGSWA